jgi:hypothetical protein
MDWLQLWQKKNLTHWMCAQKNWSRLTKVPKHHF